MGQRNSCLAIPYLGMPPSLRFLGRGWRLRSRRLASRWSLRGLRGSLCGLVLGLLWCHRSNTGFFLSCHFHSPPLLVFCTNLFFCLKPSCPILTRRFSFPLPYVISYFPNHLLQFYLINLWKTSAGCNFRKFVKCHLTHLLSFNWYNNFLACF